MKLVEMSRENKKARHVEEQRIIAVFNTAMKCLKDNNTKQWINTLHMKKVYKYRVFLESQ